MNNAGILYSRDRIQDAVREIGGGILAWLRAEDLDLLHVLSVLEGARPFTRDLVAYLRRNGPDLHFEVHEVKVKGTSGTALLEGRQMDLGDFDPGSVRPGPILIVDDLADSGKTIERLRGALLEKGSGQVLAAALIRKWAGEGIPLDFCGLEPGWDRQDLERQGLRDRWLYGYGMDLDGSQRELDHVGWVDIPL